VELSLPVKSERGTLAAIEALLAGFTSVIAGQLRAVTPLAQDCVCLPIQFEQPQLARYRQDRLDKN